MLDAHPSLQPLPPDPAPDWAWFLDVDGTLVPLAPTPEAARMPDGLAELLAALMRHAEGALALVSGRPVESVRRLLAPFRAPTAGLHGLERAGLDGPPLRPRQTAGLDDIRAALMAYAGTHPGLILEDKDLSLALHYRQAPHLQQEARRVVEDVSAHHPGLTILAGKMVFEIGPMGWGKGDAVRAFMAAPPFLGRVPVFIGDDVTDEHGFRAVEEMGGVSVLVGPARPSVARHRLPDVAACLSWLAAAAGHPWPPGA